MGPYWQVGLICVLFLFSAFFSGIEAALFSLSQVALTRIKRRNPHRGDRITVFLRDPNSVINVIITGNTIVNVAFSVVWSSMFLRAFGRESLTLAVLSGTLLLLLIGELIPKVIAIANPETFAYVGVPFLELFSKLLSPLAKVFEKILAFLFSRIGIKAKKMDFSLTEDELEALLELGEQEGVLDETEKEMLQEAMDLDERTVDEIMTPRVDIVAVDVLSSFQELRKIAEVNRHSKLPVYKGTIDYILGYVRLKEVLLHPEKDWRSFMRKALMVPETKSITKLLEDFREEGEDLAIVVDEYGGTAGLVTIEDVIEELLGNIVDEFDVDQTDMIQRSDGAYIVSGMMSLRDLAERLKIDFDVDEIDTVGGFVMHKLGYVPKGGERFLYKGWVWEVERVKGNRVIQVVIKAG